MRFAKRYAAICLLFALAGCAVNKEGRGTEEYVEIPNPAITMSPNAPETVWVPRSYVDSGVPRGGELVKKGYESLKGTPASAPQRLKTATVQPAAPVPLKSRIALLEVGDHGLLLPSSDKLTGAAVGVMLPASLSAPVAKDADLATPAGRRGAVTYLQQKFGTTVAVLVSAPDQVAPGKSVLGEIYDGMSGELLSSVSAAIPFFSPGDAAGREASLGKALTELAGKTKSAVDLLPWYAKVVAIDGDRIYVNAGSEAGVVIGQQLRLHRPGKVVPGLGYALGDRNGTLEITGLVGTNGAYGVVKEGKGIQTDDLVALE